MLAVAVIAFMLSGFALFPYIGIYVAMLSSVLALISFRAHTGLSGAAFMVNLVNTAFLSPTIFIQAMVSQDKADAGTSSPFIAMIDTAFFNYWFFVGFHMTLFIAANAWRLRKGPAAPKAQP